VIGDNPAIAPEADVDLFQVELAAGDRLRVDVEATSIGSSLDAVLRLFDGTGKAIALSQADPTPSQGDSGDAFLSFTAESAGVYYLGVSGQGNLAYDPLVEGSGSGTSTGRYDIAMTRVPFTEFFSFDLAAQMATAYGRAVPYQPVEVGGINLGQFFDQGYYVIRNPDVAGAVNAGAFQTAYEHFVQYGWLEGRDGSVLFNEQAYLAEHDDVANAVANGSFSSGFQHFALFGHQEGRDPGGYFSQADYLTNNPDVAAAVEAKAFGSGFEHYVEFGAQEGRAPELSVYQEDFYLAEYKDVANAVAAGELASGFDHFARFGAIEGRDPSPLLNNEDYLAANPDVASAVRLGLLPSGVIHYAVFGATEGRPLA
jgi:hypothetical protein